MNHFDLIDLTNFFVSEEDQFEKKIDAEGVCYGFSSMATNAALLNDFQNFNQRLMFLDKLLPEHGDMDNLKKKINDLGKKQIEIIEKRKNTTQQIKKVENKILELNQKESEIKVEITNRESFLENVEKAFQSNKEKYTTPEKLDEIIDITNHPQVFHEINESKTKASRKDMFEIIFPEVIKTLQTEIADKKASLKIIQREQTEQIEEKTQLQENNSQFEKSFKNASSDVETSLKKYKNMQEKRNEKLSSVYKFIKENSDPKKLFFIRTLNDFDKRGIKNPQSKKELLDKGPTWVKELLSNVDYDELEKYVKESEVMKLTDEELTLLEEMPAFFQGIYTQQNGTYEKDLSDKQSYMEKNYIARPALLDNDKPVLLNRSFHALNVTDTEDYFNKLAETFGSKSAQMILGSRTHAVQLSYNPDNKKWILLDANHLPKNNYRQGLTSSELAQELNDTLCARERGEISYDSKNLFFMEIIGKGQDNELTKKLNKLNDDMKSKEDVDFITIKKNKITGLLTLAIQHGTADDVKALFGINTKLRGMDCDLAIYRNDPDIFHELLTNNKSKLNYYEKSQILNKWSGAIECIKDDVDYNKIVAKALEYADKDRRLSLVDQIPFERKKDVIKLMNYKDKSKEEEIKNILEIGIAQHEKFQAFKKDLIELKQHDTSKQIDEIVSPEEDLTHRVSKNL
jgi:hypothetical protein